MYPFLPFRIEKFAIRMKVDLTHVLAQACLPHVALFNNTIPLNKLIQSQDISTGGNCGNSLAI